MRNKDTRGLIKAISMNNLQGNWFRAFLIFIIISLASSFILGFLPIRYPTQEQMMAVAETGDYLALMKLFLPATITKKTIAAIGVVFLLNLVVMCPMNVGRCRFFLRVAAGQKGEMTDFFSPFADLRLVFSSIVLELIITAVTAFMTFAFCLAPIVAMVFAIAAGFGGLVDLFYLLTVAAAFISMLWCSRYTFARFILAEGKSGAFRSFGLCLGLCKGRARELMALRASYFLWDVLQIFPIFAYVYQTLFGAVYARYLYHIRGDIRFVSREEAENKEEAGQGTEQNGDAE